MTIILKNETTEQAVALLTPQVTHVTTQLGSQWSNKYCHDTVLEHIIQNCPKVVALEVADCRRLFHFEALVEARHIKVHCQSCHERTQWNGDGSTMAFHHVDFARYSRFRDEPMPRWFPRSQRDLKEQPVDRMQQAPAQLMDYSSRAFAR
jgi:hypothetical protein